MLHHGQLIMCTQGDANIVLLACRKSLFVHDAMLKCAGMKGKTWATFIPAEPVTVSPRVQQPRGVSVIAKDFQTVALYNADGTFAGIRRPGSNKPIEVCTSFPRC